MQIFCDLSSADKIAVVAAFIAFIGLGINAVIVWFLAGHLKEFRRQATAIENSTQAFREDAITRDKMEKTKIRARIRVIPNDPWYSFGFTEATEIYSAKTNIGISCKIVNIGQTSAINIHIEAICSQVKYGERVGDGLGNYHIFNPTNITLITGDRLDIGTQQSGFKIPTFSIKTPDFENIKTGEKTDRLFFWGYIKFEDIFENKWSQEFAWEVSFRGNDQNTIKSITATGFGSNKEISLDDLIGKVPKKA